MEQGNELGIDLMAPAYNFMLFKIFSKNENDTEAVYDLRTKEDAVSYTHLDVYKRQFQVILLI